MKKSILSIALVTVFGLTATASTPIEKEKKVVKVDQSTVTWKGYKVTGSHVGTIALESGFLTMDNGKLVGGEFVVDMSTLSNSDLEGDSKGKLVGHLKSDDFFGVEKYPTANLVFTSVKTMNKNSYTVTGNLTIKEITKPITFVVSVYENKATATMKVDRAEYDVRYGSGSFFDDLGDKTIYDEFDLVVDMAL